MATDIREAAVRALAEDREIPRDLIEVVRVKQQGDVAVVAATFRGSSGRLVRAFVGLEQTDAFGWTAAGGGWTSAPRDVVHDAIWSSSGGWGPADGRRAPAVAGGWVKDPTARSIRVSDPNGRVEEDDVESGVAILIWTGDFNAWSATVELLDAEGRVIQRGPMRPLRHAM